MGEKRPRHVLIAGCGIKKVGGQEHVFPPRGLAETSAAASQHRAEKITVSVDADLLQCCVCSGPLTTPLFQCTKGHLSCSECCTGMNDECECLMCREPETDTRCHAMERVLAGLSMPCAFRQHGCAETISYAWKQSHEASCRYAPWHCPIHGCAGYRGDVRNSLLHHITVDHPDVHHTHVRSDCLTPLRMRAFEPARVVLLNKSHCLAEFLLVVGRDVPSGRSLGDELFDEEFDDCKYRIEVVGKDGVLTLSGQAVPVQRLARPYQASAFLFVPDAIWDSSPVDIPVFIHLK